MSDKIKEYKQQLVKIEAEQAEWEAMRKRTQDFIDSVDRVLNALARQEEFYTNRIDELEAKK